MLVLEPIMRLEANIESVRRSVTVTCYVAQRTNNAIQFVHKYLQSSRSSQQLKLKIERFWDTKHLGYIRLPCRVHAVSMQDV